MTIEELKLKVKVYENILHDISMFSSITMDPVIMEKIIDMINSWSYAHRQGNGIIDNKKLVDKIFIKLKNGDYKNK